MHRWAPVLDRPEIRVVRVVRPALVLGSTQPSSVINPSIAAELGFEVTRRRSGGGVVELGPASVWVDVTLPSSDPRYRHDIGRAAEWMGALWVDALAGSGVSRSSLSVHSGVAVAAAEGRVVCFAGVGSGEVLLHGRKLVGISQRRSRAGAWFQCVAYREWSPSRMLSTVRPPPDTPTSIEAIDVRCRDHVAALGVAPDVLVASLEYAVTGGRARP